ncbi:MAG: LysM peptidoglycan-binding domain-containing protein [Candidatus Promineofilum sp.]|nr:LysM peptidoglycan-binding domain-containing protein [Promineifilum sp.]
MNNRRPFLLVVLVTLVMAALAAPLRLLAQTAEPPLPTPTLAAPGTESATPDPAAPFIPRVHVVQDGENLTIIATNFGVSVEEILAINNLANGDLLAVGQELIIPGGTGEAIATAYAVTPGDTLAGIAAGFNTTLEAVMTTNRLIIADPPLIVGQSVPVISRTGSGGIRPVTGRPYLAEAGDTLLLVAARFGLPVEQLAAANNLASGSRIFPGQRLRIPDETAVYRDLPQGWLDVRLSSLTVAQGESLSISVANLLDGKPAGRFGDQPLHFVPHDDGYVALVGIDAFAEPGLYDLELTGGDERGLWAPVRARLPLTETAYDTQYIELGEALDGLLDPAVRATEDEFLKGIYADFSEEQRWSGVFQVPLTTTIVSAGYGGRRSYNGGPVEIYHTGIDYAAAAGTTVLAPAAGVVVFSDVLELRGGTLIIDHGLGVMTGYYHLSERLVEPGQAVTAGQPIARVGSTGLSSGAHLHWDLRIMNVTVDPARWTERVFP